MSEKNASDKVVTVLILSDDGFVQMMAILLRNVAQDLKYGDYNTRMDAEHFLKTELFDDICTMFNMPSKKVEKMIRYNVIQKRVFYD